MQYDFDYAFQADEILRFRINLVKQRLAFGHTLDKMFTFVAKIAAETCLREALQGLRSNAKVEKIY